MATEFFLLVRGLLDFQEEILRSSHMELFWQNSFLHDSIPHWFITQASVFVVILGCDGYLWEGESWRCHSQYGRSITKQHCNAASPATGKEFIRKSWENNMQWCAKCYRKITATLACSRPSPAQSDGSRKNREGWGRVGYSHLSPSLSLSPPPFFSCSPTWGRTPLSKHLEQATAT